MDAPDDGLLERAGEGGAKTTVAASAWEGWYAPTAGVVMGTGREPTGRVLSFCGSQILALPGQIRERPPR